VSLTGRSPNRPKTNKAQSQVQSSLYGAGRSRFCALFLQRQLFDIGAQKENILLRLDQPVN
jgi:hypothetical protein